MADAPRRRGSVLWSRIAMVLLPLLLGPLLVRELAEKKFPIRLGAAPHLRLFLVLSDIQEGLFVALVVATIGWLASRVANRWLRFGLYFPVWVGVIWLTLWALVRAEFSVLLSARY